MERFAPILVVFGAVSYAMVGIILEVATHHGYPVQKIIVGMYLLSFIVLHMLYCVSKKTNSSLSRKEFLLFLSLGIFTISITYCFYHSLRFVGVPIATLLLMQSSWMTPLLSACLRKTSLAKKDIISMCFIVFGVFLSAYSHDVTISFAGIGWGLAAALSYSIMLLCSSNLAKEKSVLEKSSAISLGAFLISLVLFHNDSHVDFLSERTYWSLLYALFATILPLTLLATGLKYISANLAGALITLEIPAAYVLSALFLADHITINQTLGCLIITLSIGLPKVLNKKKPNI